MRKEYEPLFTPAKIGNCEIPNRFIMCAMEGTTIVNWMMAKPYDGSVHDLLVNRAKDGVGLIIPGALHMRSFVGKKWCYQYPQAFTGVDKLFAEIHQYGSKIFPQITCGMGRSFPMLNIMAENKDLIKPFLDVDYFNASADEGLPNIWNENEKTHGLTVEEIHEFINAYAETAYLMKQLGADGVEVHAVHEGYLMDSFTTKYMNHRTDEYGGSMENRYRFPIETVQAIKKRCGADFPVLLRYSVTSKTKGIGRGIVPGDDVNLEIGRDMEESEQAIQMLTDAGYDGFDCDNGTYDAWYYAHPPVYMPFNCNLAEAEHIKKFTDKPIGCAGRMQLEDSAKAIAENKLDFVGIARQFLTDDQYLTKIKEEKEEDIIPCISCHTGCLPLARWKDSGCVTNFTEQYGICALNPYTRNEKRYAPHPAAHPRKIAVIGGGVAGMEAALRTAAEGHNVTLYEKSGVLGGVYIAASAESYKENDRKLLAYYRAQLAKSSVHVCMNTEIKDLKQIDADEIIVATGSQKTRELTCYGHEYAVSAVDYLLGRQKVGDNVVIVGGGLTGCEIAYELAKQGKHPAIVEVRNDLIIGPGISMANSHYLKDALIYYRVPEYLESSVKEVRKYAAVVEDKDGNLKEIPADNVIVSMGYIAGNPYADQQDPRVHVIGDANHIGNLRKAIWAANDLAVELSK